MALDSNDPTGGRPVAVRLTPRRLLPAWLTRAVAEARATAPPLAMPVVVLTTPQAGAPRALVVLEPADWCALAGPELCMTIAGEKGEGGTGFACPYNPLGDRWPCTPRPLPSPNGWLDRLRAVVGDREWELVGYDRIAAWFAEVGWATRAGRPPSVRTLKRWRAAYHLPVAVTPHGRVWTTSYLLMVWCLSPGARRLAPRRADGTLTAPVNARRAGRPRGGRRPPPRPPATPPQAEALADQLRRELAELRGAPEPAALAYQSSGCRFCAEWVRLPAGRRCSVCGRAG